MHRGLSVLRVALVAVLGFCLWNAGAAKAADIEVLMVPSAAMGRDIPVAFLAGGPHAAYLLDGFNAGPDVSNWVTAGNGFNILAGKGISVIAPAGGAHSMYTNWEPDGSKQWETFLSSELPDWLAANKGLAPGGHGVVGVSQGGYAAAALVTFHPDRFRYAGSLSGFLTPEGAGVDGTITAALKQGGANSNQMWGPPQLGRWKWHSPNQNFQQLVDNNARLWVYSPAAARRLIRVRWPATAISPKAPTRRSTRTIATSAAPTATSTWAAAAATTGRRGADSWAQCPAIWPRTSASAHTALVRPGKFPNPLAQKPASNVMSSHDTCAAHRPRAGATWLRLCRRGALWRRRPK
jgi:S-formylglutathione hydrolase FrmB